MMRWRRHTKSVGLIVTFLSIAHRSRRRNLELEIQFSRNFVQFIVKNKNVFVLFQNDLVLWLGKNAFLLGALCQFYKSVFLRPSSSEQQNFQALINSALQNRTRYGLSKLVLA
jgi:hypothetical protein